jgi:acetyl-CoA carboxylase carboxyltransferase component
MQGTVIEVQVEPGAQVIAGQTVVIMDSMKMEHEIRTQVSGVVASVSVAPGDTIYEHEPLLQVDAAEVQGDTEHAADVIDPDYIRPDLAEVVERRGTTLDQQRPQAVARRRKTNQRTARENVEDLCDSGTFVEYGQMVLAAQRRRRSVEELIEKSPADGMITGVGAVNGSLFDAPDNRCVIMSYDYTVLAGTQGTQNHRKTDRMIRVSEDGRMPMVLFAEGGGGRPGDTDGLGGEGTTTFARFAQLSGLVPMIGITSGRCFAGNASLLGCCDVIIATENSNIGMGGPAMIEGGGLGIYAPEEIGPMSVQVANGVVDVLAADETEAVRVAQQYLSYFQGPTENWTTPDQRTMRHIIPENRLRVYDVTEVINTLADEGSVLYLREGFGHGAVTALIRVEGQPVGVIANNPKHLGGAIDSDAADKSARFMQLCDAFDIPLLYLCDTPGIMVGPEIEKTALVRHSSRMFLTGANLSVPFFTIILRKAYGLGAIAMAGGSYKTPFFTVSWPTGEFGGMGLEGSVKLGYRNELAAIEDPEARRQKYEEMVARAYQNGKALNYASLFSVDDTIDPADSRFWVANLLKSVRREPRSGKKRSNIDAW